MSTLTRPKLGSRAISDMQPLMNPIMKTTEGQKDLGRGTQAISGGARVVSGGRTALGGIAPLSPFLPLPPAIEQEEVEKQQQELSSNSRLNNNRFLSVQSSVHSRSVSGSKMEGENSAPMNRGHFRPAPMMIRSYSMPVATQSDYEAQRETIKRRHQYAAQHKAQTEEEQPWEANWVQDTQQIKGRPLYHTTTSMKLKINNENSMTNSISSMGAPKESSTLPSRKKPSPRLQSRSPLSIITINTHPSSTIDNGVEMDLGSGSDEADVVTPRASSPHDDYFSKSIKVDVDETHDILSEFIHPDHLRPPPAFGF